MNKPYAWYCETCKKFDIAHEKEALAKPQHIPHRGFDIGECRGIMIPLYKEETEKRKNNEV